MSKMRIAIVDDQSNNRGIVSRILSRVIREELCLTQAELSQKVEFYEFASSAEFFASIVTFQLVTLDYNLNEDITGGDIASRIRRESGDNVVIIGISSEDFYIDKSRINLGDIYGGNADAFVQKPVRSSSIRAAIVGLFANGQVYRSNPRHISFFSNQEEIPSQERSSAGPELR